VLIVILIVLLIVFVAFALLLVLDVPLPRHYAPHTPAELARQVRTRASAGPADIRDAPGCPRRGQRRESQPAVSGWPGFAVDRMLK
jgi:hypothetical protein